MPAGPTAVLSPHLDDAVLSAWSVLRRGVEVRVINVCTGAPEPGFLSVWDRTTGATDSRTRMDERQAEDAEALAQAGREGAALGFPEAQYRDGPLDAAALGDAIRSALDGATEVWAPAGLGGHPDHVLVRDAALGFVDGPAVHLYADLPYAARAGWPGWVTGRSDHPFLGVEEMWAPFLPAGVALEHRRHVLGPSEAAHKRRALTAYRTQLPGLDAGPIRLLARADVIGYEVSWAVGAP